MNSLDELVKLLSKLPGIGGKSASRIAYHLLQSDANYNKLLGDKIESKLELLKVSTVFNPKKA